MQSENNVGSSFPGIEDLNVTGLLPFNFRNLEGDYLLTNDIGHSHYLKQDEFNQLITGKMDDSSELYAELRAEGFIQGAVSNVDYRDQFWSARAGNLVGPSLHSFELSDPTGVRMSLDYIEKGVTFALATTNSEVTIEFRGEGSLTHWEGVCHCIDFARSQNKTIGKQLSFVLVHSLLALDEEKLDYLIENKVQICAVLAPPEAEDTEARTNTLNWVRAIHGRYEEAGLEPKNCRVEMLQTMTSDSFPFYKEVVDGYTAVGARTVFLRDFLAPESNCSSPAERDASVSGFAEFYKNLLGYILELGRSGGELTEQFAAYVSVARKGEETPSYLSLRFHRAPVTGQVAYGADGKVYSSYEGLEVAASGDEFFVLGTLESLTYSTLIESSQAKAIIMGGNKESLPGVGESCHKASLQVQSEYNYLVNGSINGRVREALWYRKQIRLFDHLAKCMNTTDENSGCFERWSVTPDRSYFLQD